MKTSETTRRFNEVLEKQLNGKTAAEIQNAEDQALLQLAERLQAAESPRSERHARALKTRLLAQQATHQAKKPPIKRWSWAGAAATLAVLAVLTLTIPPLRVFAQEILQKIGNYLFVDQPTYAEQVVATLQSGTPTSTPDPMNACSNCLQEDRVSLELASQAEASRLAGFRVYMPEHIPAGFSADATTVLETEQTITATTSFRAELPLEYQDSFLTEAVLSLTQTQLKANAEPWIFETGGVEPEAVTLRGLEGAWVEGVAMQPYQDENGNWQYVRWNMLLWEEDNFQFRLQTNMPLQVLTREELLLVAESMVK